MTMLSITINDPSPALPSKSAEIQYLLKVLDHIELEMGRGRGTVTTGTVLGNSAAGTANTSLGSWTYTPTATKP